MKKKEIENMFVKYGWYLKRQGGNHEVWTNGEIMEYLPRHKEINERLAEKILKNVKKNPNRDKG